MADRRYLRDESKSINMSPRSKENAIKDATALVNYTSENNYEKVEELLKKGVHVNIKDKNLNTPLHYTAFNGYTTLAKLLISYNANINLKNKDGNTPLYLAVHNKFTETVELLLDRGSDVNVMNNNGHTPLSIAVGLNYIDAVIFLLKAGADVNAKNGKGNTPLVLAVNNNYINIVELLLSHNADVNIVDGNGNSSLIIATNNKNIEIIELLITKGADVNMKNKVNVAPLSIAIDKNSIEIVSLLVDAGADANIQDDENHTPLHRAVHHKYIDIIRFLLNNGADTNITDDANQTPLYFAVTQKDQIIADLLLQNGADPNIQHISTKYTPLHIAVYNGDVGMVQLLLDNGADFNIKNKNNNTPIRDAIFRNSIEIVRLFLNIPILNIPSVNINEQNAHGVSYLHLAVIKGFVEIVQLLLEKGANKELKTNIGKTALDLAKETNNVEIIRLLTDSGTNNKKYTGFTKSDVALFNQLFEKPNDFSVCPVCLEFAYRLDGCMFMGHACKTPHSALFALYSSGGLIEWCTICGRVCNQHRHYKYAAPTATTLPTIAPYAELVQEYFGNEAQCIKLGGGGIAEKVRRFHRLLTYACQLQEEVGKIDDIEARSELIEETWKAADIRNRNVPKILANKNFGFPCTFPEVTVAPNTTNRVYPNIQRPADEAALVPIRHDAPDNECSVEMGAHADGRPVWEFQHKQPDGSIFKHEEEFICAQDLVTTLRENPLDGRCYTTSCKGKLYPEELKNIVTPEFYEVYRQNFNRANAIAQGGGEGLPLLRPINMNSVTCSVPQGGRRPRKTRRKRVRKNRRKSKNNRHR